MEKLINDYDKELELRKELIGSDGKSFDNSFVMAGAGAGKTYSLVHRIANQVMNGANVSEIVAISFTNKSAEDLRARIIEALNIDTYKEEDKAKLTEEQKKNMVKALNEIDLMHISTIHKFCSDLVRENSIYANVSPDFEMIIDDTDRINRILSQYLRKSLKKEDFVPLKKLFSNRDKFIGDIRSLYGILAAHVDKIEKCDIVGSFDVQKGKIDSTNNKLKDSITLLLTKIKNNSDYLYEVAYPDGKKESINIYKKPFQFIDSLDIDDINDNIINNVIDNSDPLANPMNGNAFRAEAKKQALEEFLDDYTPLYLDFKKCELDIRKIYINYVLKYAYEIYENYLNEINNDSISVSTDQLLVVTKRMLENKEIVGNETIGEKIIRKLQKKYKHIYIDEYQDTDHIQRDIALLLTRIINTDDLIDDSLFLVGDPKQSIYRFRGAEPEVYFDTKEIFDKPNTKQFELNINFRSNGKILEYVNDIFTKIPLTKEAYKPMLVKKANEISNSDYQKKENLIGFYKTHGAEPQQIADLINYIKDNYKIRKLKKRMVNGKEEEYPVYEQIKYNDIMVQLPIAKRMGKYIKTFSDNKIPSKVSGASDFYSVYQVRAFINLFEALNKRGNAAIRTAYEAFKFLYPSKYQSKTEKESLEISSDLLDGLKNEINGMSSYGIAIYLIENINWINKEDELLETFEYNSIKSKLYQMVEQVFTTDYINGSKAALAFRDYVDKKIEYESLIDDEADAVSVINVHKAKGLEAPIVIFVCMKSAGGGYTTYYKNKLYIYESNGLDFYSDNEELLDEIENEVDLEKRRLEYVAATRPREAFIYALTDDDVEMFNNPDYYDDVIISPDRIITIEKPEEDDEDGEAPKDTGDYDIFVPQDHSLTNSGSLYNITSPSSKENGSSPTRNSLYDKAQKEGINTNSNRPKGNILGTVLHRACELLVLDKNDNKSIDVSDITNRAINENIDDIKDVSSYQDFIEACLISLNKEFENGIYSNELYPELSFCTKIDNNEITNGSIDLLSVSKDEIVIYDYKSDVAEYITDDSVFEQTLVEKYKNQLDDYEKVVKGLYSSLPIVKKIIYFRRYNRDKRIVEAKICNI